ncbi:MAG: class I SAM-dependent methyltransferase [Sphingomicrobium sp.]
MPNAAATQQLLRSIWQGFAASLARDACVLDLATGNGAVLEQLVSVRPDLSLIGIDYAPSLPAPHFKAIQLRSGVSLEHLPFEARSFDAATSQFGFEYSDRSQASAELARVLRKDAPFLFIVHDRSGSLLAENRERMRALNWIKTSGLLDKARGVANARRTTPLATPANFGEACRDARNLFPQEIAAEEIAVAILQTLDAGRVAGPDPTIAALDEIESRIAEELFLLQSLDRAACDQSQIAELAKLLDSAGLEASKPQPVAGPTGPFAWRLAGRRRD